MPYKKSMKVSQETYSEIASLFQEVYDELKVSQIEVMRQWENEGKQVRIVWDMWQYIQKTIPKDRMPWYPDDTNYHTLETALLNAFKDLNRHKEESA